MEKKDDELVAKVEELIKNFEELMVMAAQNKKTIKEILKSGWEDGVPLLSERKKELERVLKEMDVLAGDDVFPDENDHIH